MCRNVISAARTDERRALWLLQEGQVLYMNGLGVPDVRAAGNGARSPISIIL